MNNKAVYVSESVTSIQNVVSIVPINKRIIPMPNMVYDFLMKKNIGTKKPEHFVFTNSLALVAHSKTVTTVFKRIIQSEPDLKGILPMSLRATFIRRCLEANLNVESVSAITGVDKSYIYKFYGMYIKADLSAIFQLDRSDASKSNRQKQLNLLILGAGSHGHNVKETAEKLGVFQKIRFLDDIVEGEEIVGRASDCALFVKEYPCAFVAIGDNEKRKYYTEKLRKCGFMLSTLIHPDTTVSKNAVIGEGTIIMAQATVNAATVGDCCIVASNALVNFGAKISDYSHLDCGAMVLKDAEVPEGTMVESGMIFRA